MAQADKWELFERLWSLGDDDAPITDASAADNYEVEKSITDFQAAAKLITDIVVAFSSARNQTEDVLRKLRETVTIAYSYACDGRFSDVKKVLEEVVDL